MSRSRLQRPGAMVSLLALTAASPAVAAAPTKPPPNVHEALEAGRWAFAIALLALAVGLPLLILVVGGIFTKFRAVSQLLPWKIVAGVIVGADNRVSTSKTVALLWTYGVASALLSLVIARWLGHPGALDQQNQNGLQANYALLIGGPLGAAILAKAVVVGQLENGSKSKTEGDPAASQLVTNDAGTTDLGDLQYVLFNTVALVFFFGEFLLAEIANGGDAREAHEQVWEVRQPVLRRVQWPFAGATPWNVSWNPPVYTQYDAGGAKVGRTRDLD